VSGAGTIRRSPCIILVIAQTPGVILQEAFYLRFIVFIIYLCWCILDCRWHREWVPDQLLHAASFRRPSYPRSLRRPEWWSQLRMPWSRGSCVSPWSLFRPRPSSRPPTETVWHPQCSCLELHRYGLGNQSR